jgi:hypothetical protein
MTEVTLKQGGLTFSYSELRSGGAGPRSLAMSGDSVKDSKHL